MFVFLFFLSAQACIPFCECVTVMSKASDDRLYKYCLILVTMTEAEVPSLASIC